jgi:hypothetical protein
VRVRELIDSKFWNDIVFKHFWVVFWLSEFLCMRVCAFATCLWLC